jgi:hypothetical protein
MVAPTSNSLPATMPRSLRSKISDTAVRSEPKRRVENQTNPSAE